GKPDVPPIIMITANEGSRHKAYAEYLGVVDYIRKPFAMERLMEAVNKAFAQTTGPAKEDEEEFGGGLDAGGGGDKSELGHEQCALGLLRLPRDSSPS